MEKNPFPYKGLSLSEVSAARLRYGINKIGTISGSSFWLSLKEAITEPMFLLLVLCACIYFFLGQLSEAWFMLGAIILVAAISLYQARRSSKALEALKKYTQASTTVIRDNQLLTTPIEDLVVGDYVVIAEGELIPADGVIKQINDFTVNESILTGEAFAVSKTTDAPANRVYSGTFVTSGQCIFEIMGIGINTMIGQIGLSLDNINKSKTQLQLQINAFVKQMAIIGSVVFILMCVVNYMRYGNAVNSLLKGLTIAMSVLPEEIPVAFSVFMAIGALRLMKQGVIVKETGTVEALGSASVLCMDKTGTITENKMELVKVYDASLNTLFSKEAWNAEQIQNVVTYGMWASETIPFDPMEKAIHTMYSKFPTDERRLYHMVHEYPLNGKPPMMTHIFEDEEGNRIIACKGAPEAIINCSRLHNIQKEKILAINTKMASEGLRVLGVGKTSILGTIFPEIQQELSFDFLGLIAFYDPPKKDMAIVLEKLYIAGLQLKIISGDHAATTIAIAKEVGIKGWDKTISGEQLTALNESDFEQAVTANTIFYRMFPEMKLKIVNSIKRQGYIVGMTGDGVNDGPALKAADIGIAMGKSGTEIAKQASALILTDDDFGKMVDAIAMGRRIYTNLRKAIRYIISIHIPIILTVAIPSVLGWRYPAIFTPVHVIFLELVMGPTCSVIYENEPVEQNAMLQPPRSISKPFFSFRELFISIIQGLGITCATIFIYQYAIQNSYSENITRSLVFCTLILANIFLTLVNRSFHYSIFKTIRYKNNLMVSMVMLTASITAVILYLPVVAAFFHVSALSLSQLFLCFAAAVLSVLWFEVYKFFKRSNASK